MPTIADARLQNYSKNDVAAERGNTKIMQAVLIKGGAINSSCNKKSKEKR